MIKEKSLQDITEELDSAIRGLGFFSIICSLSDENQIDISEITYLIDPIINKQRELCDAMFKISYPDKTLKEVNNG